MKCVTLIGAAVLVAGCQEHNPVAPVSLVPLLQTGAPTAKTNATVPLEYSFFSSCTGELLRVSGKLHVVTTVWNDSDRLRIHSHTQVNASADGLASGLNYRLLQVSNQQFVSSWETGAGEADVVFIFNVISTSRAPNFYLTMNGTWRYGADGSVSVEPKKWETNCR